MKKYIKEEWAGNNNPFKDNFQILEAPINKQLPIGNTDEEPETSTLNEPPLPSANPNDEKQSNAPDEPGQEKMPGINSPEQDFEYKDTEDLESSIDFETEKIDYMNLAINQKHDEMMDKLLEMRDINNLSPGQYKFIEDNISILSLSRDVDFADAQKKIYKKIKSKFEELIQSSEQEQEQDVNQFSNYNPGWNLKRIKLNEEKISEEISKNISGIEIYSILSEEIERYPSIVNTMLKFPSFYAMKSDLYRKTIAALINGIQIGSGGTLEDIFIPILKEGIGIKICTRCYTEFSNIQIGKWILQFNDPENYLSDSELEKLHTTGSPEEKEVLRKRVVIESISETFKDKIYMILISDPKDGSRHEIGFNFSDLIIDGWKNGYISVDFKANVGKGEAGVKVDGEMIDLQDISIAYVKEDPSNLDEEGLPSKKNIELIKLINGYLYVVILEDDFSSFVNVSQSGIFYSKKYFDTGPEELKKIQRCIPDIKEIILKQC